VFLGRFTHTIDTKGRLSIPVKYRETINKKDPKGVIYLATGLESCLVVYTRPEWDRLIEKIEQLPAMNQEVSDYRRLLFSGATECSLDKQGRILIPQNLREHAGLSGDTYLVGNNSKFEIWHPEKWAAVFRRTSGNFGSIQKGLAAFGV